MIVHEIFAQIVDEKVVNIIVCDNYPTADYLTKCIYGNEAFAVDCLQYSCHIGNAYHDGFFWNVLEDGTEEKILPNPTEEQEVQTLKAENKELILAFSDAIGGV